MDSVTLTMLVFIFICVAPGLWMGYYFGPPGLAARAKKAEAARARFLREGIQASARVLTMQMGSCIVVLDGLNAAVMQLIALDQPLAMVGNVVRGMVGSDEWPQFVAGLQQPQWLLPAEPR